MTALERFDKALISSRAALAASCDAQYDVSVAYGLQHVAAIAALRVANQVERGRNDRLRAAHLLGYVDVRLGALEALREYTEQQEYDKVLAALRDALGEERISKLKQEGSIWSEDQALAEAMLI